MSSPWDKRDEAPGLPASFALVLGLAFMSVFTDNAIQVLSSMPEETQSKSGSTPSLLLHRSRVSVPSIVPETEDLWVFSCIFSFES